MPKKRSNNSLENRRSAGVTSGSTRGVPLRSSPADFRYWAERARQNKLNVIKIGENGINELKRVLKTNLDDVQKDIKAFYDKYGENPADQLSYKEFEQYKKGLERNRTKYKIIEESEQSDGSIIVKVIKQYNASPVGDYLD